MTDRSYFYYTQQEFLFQYPSINLHRTVFPYIKIGSNSKKLLPLLNFFLTVILQHFTKDLILSLRFLLSTKYILSFNIFKKINHITISFQASLWLFCIFHYVKEHIRILVRHHSAIGHYCVLDRQV